LPTKASSNGGGRTRQRCGVAAAVAPAAAEAAEITYGRLRVTTATRGCFLFIQLFVCNVVRINSFIIVLLHRCNYFAVYYYSLYNFCFTIICLYQYLFENLGLQVI